MKKKKSKKTEPSVFSRYLDDLDQDSDDEAKQLAEHIKNGIIRPDKFHLDE